MRRRFAFFAIVGSVVGSVFVACGSESPIIVITPEAQAPDQDGSSDPPQDDGGVLPDALIDAAFDSTYYYDGQSADALINRDAGGKVDASGCGSCDCDGDGDNRPACGDDAGQDCDDRDTRYRTTQSFVEDKPDPGKDGNWNCKNGVEKLYPSNVSCALVSVGDCTGAQGFTGDPGCGESGAYVTCTTVLLGLLLCLPAKTEIRTQACR